MNREIKELREEFNKKLDKLEAKLDEIKWTKIGDLEWSEPLGEMNWHESTNKCKEMGGRLPTRTELIDLIDNHSEEIKDWNKNCYLWSATQSCYTQSAWLTYLYYGYACTFAKTSTYDSRCVR